MVLCACCPLGLLPHLSPERPRWTWPKLRKGPFKRGAGPLGDQSVCTACALCSPGAHIAFLPSPSVCLLLISAFMSFVCVCNQCPRCPFPGLL